MIFKMRNAKQTLASIDGLLLILFFLFAPSIAFADYTITTNSNTTALYTIGTGEYTNTAQSFTTIGAGTVTSAQVCLYKSGSPSGTVTVGVYALSGSNPTGTSLGDSDSINASTLSTSPCTLATFTFSVPVSVAATTGYILVVSRSASDGAVVVGGLESTSPVIRLSSNSGSSWGAGIHQASQSIFVTESGGGGGGSSTTPQVFSTTTQLIDNPTQDFTNGLYLFLAGFGLVVLLFNKRR